jgi:hypothetical protein
MTTRAGMTAGLAGLIALIATGLYAAQYAPVADGAATVDVRGVAARPLPQPVDASTDWLARSPFVADHSAYARPVAPPPPPPEAPPVEIRLLGVSRSGGEPQATVMLDGEERTLSLGAETLAGEVVEIGLDFIVFEQDGEQRRVGLFD